MVNAYRNNLIYMIFHFRLIIMAVEFSRFQEEFKCDGNHLIRTYLRGLILLFTVVVVMNAIIVHYSMKGTIINYAPRKRVPQLLHVRGFIMVLEWIWDIIGKDMK